MHKRCIPEQKPSFFFPNVHALPGENENETKRNDSVSLMHIWTHTQRGRKREEAPFSVSEERREGGKQKRKKECRREK